MAQVLLVIGASIFGVLGTLHLVFTFFTNKFDSHNPLVKDAMKESTPKLTKETTMWRAWIGFNASHSLGAILVAAFYIPLSIYHFDLIRQSNWFSLFPSLIGLSYLVLAKFYWFKIPFIGISISTLCFIGAAFLIKA